MKGRQSKAVRFVIKALADDYESADTLMTYFMNQRKPSFSHMELEQALAQLAADGYIRAYSYSDDKKTLAPAVFSSAAFDCLWFGLTAKANEIIKE